MLCGSGSESFGSVGIRAFTRVTPTAWYHSPTCPLSPDLVAVTSLFPSAPACSAAAGRSCSGPVGSSFNPRHANSVVSFTNVPIISRFGGCHLSSSPRSDSSMTRSNARKSSSLVKSIRRPTPRLRTWKTIPPGEYRRDRGIHGFLPQPPILVKFGGCHLFFPQPPILVKFGGCHLFPSPFPFPPSPFPFPARPVNLFFPECQRAWRRSMG